MIKYSWSAIKSLNHHRLEYNPLEKKFVEKWDEQNLNGHTLEYVLSGRLNQRIPLNERDQVVAKTVIQWLGTEVGQSFLEEVLGLDIRDLRYRKALDE